MLNFGGKTSWKITRRLKESIMMNFRKISCEDERCIGLA